MGGNFCSQLFPNSIWQLFSRLGLEHFFHSHFQSIKLEIELFIPIPNPNSWELNFSFPFSIPKVVNRFGYFPFPIPNVQNSFPLMPGRRSGGQSSSDSSSDSLLEGIQGSKASTLIYPWPLTVTTFSVCAKRLDNIDPNMELNPHHHQGPQGGNAILGLKGILFLTLQSTGVTWWMSRDEDEPQSYEGEVLPLQGPVQHDGGAHSEGYQAEHGLDFGGLSKILLNIHQQARDVAKLGLREHETLLAVARAAKKWEPIETHDN